MACPPCLSAPIRGKPRFSLSFLTYFMAVSCRFSHFFIHRFPTVIHNICFPPVPVTPHRAEHRPRGVFLSETPRMPTRGGCHYTLILTVLQVELLPFSVHNPFLNPCPRGSTVSVPGPAEASHSAFCRALAGRAFRGVQSVGVEEAWWQWRAAASGWSFGGRGVWAVAEDWRWHQREVGGDDVATPRAAGEGDIGKNMW